ncbi:hypothetical protein P2G88_07345 [Aliiglaciecola sp. CAU 1673]|uniref:DUF6916 family protein n=1 Tax=Aliiglaciecola sp. CAU 1673 TaxID=3032595 RepID=UPI0023DA79A7|nr:hypothetical protein [Aliiglaciecola sp. CAU 1673]MDF2178065.1 hypothetical protein [Aliiglaciecola sp. CAU 1673]
MFKRRDFILGSSAFAGLALLTPFASFRTIAKVTTPTATQLDKFHQLQKQQKWLALYDQEGTYLSDIRLLSVEQLRLDAQTDQFTLHWRSRDELQINAGTYVVDDFSSSPQSLYLAPASSTEQGVLFDAPFSLLRE